MSRQRTHYTTTRVLNIPSYRALNRISSEAKAKSQKICFKADFLIETSFAKVLLNMTLIIVDNFFIPADSQQTVYVHYGEQKVPFLNIFLLKNFSLSFLLIRFSEGRYVKKLINKET